MTIPRARAFLIEDLRNGGDPRKAHGVCEVKLHKGRVVYEGMRLSLSDLRQMSRKEWRKKCPAPAFFITGKDKGKLGYFWEHVFLKAKSGPNLGGVVNPDTGAAILDSERQKLTYLDFGDKVKLSETLTRPQDGTTQYSALWQAGWKIRVEVAMTELGAPAEAGLLHRYARYNRSPQHDTFLPDVRSSITQYSPHNIFLYPVCLPPLRRPRKSLVKWTTRSAAMNPYARRKYFWKMSSIESAFRASTLTGSYSATSSTELCRIRRIHGRHPLL